MDTINNALSELAKKESKVAIEAADVPKVKTRSPWIWVAAGFSLSLAMGGWAVSQGPSIESESVPLNHQVDVEPIFSKQPAAPVIESPTKKLTSTESQPSMTNVISEPSQSLALNSPQTVATTGKLSAAPEVANVKNNQQTEDKKTQVQTGKERTSAKPSSPVLLANVQSTSSKSTNSVVPTTPKPADTVSPQSVEPIESGIVAEQVELTPEQLAVNAIGRAKKALDSNNLEGALKGFTEALRYTPRDEDVRQKLAILYFGKGDTRRAYELLQAGIRLNNDSEALRLGLSKLLVKADQAEAALSPLLHLPNNASKEYLAMRAALSQKSQQEAIALESYQKLTVIEQD
ncbi:MSHA biogenesis protein MshN, partial [Vibrio sp. D173a]|uniref:tetratricopeptide repeat protein n=1 Tax=Vibrio sp. D173a TaxID=2836349 RepID=UPI0025569DC9